MKRRALIIGSPDDEIQGVYDDMKNYRSFLESTTGGGWYRDEIVTLECPDKLQVQSQMACLKTVDYSLVVFAGHGAYLPTQRATFLQLQPSCEISENVLKDGATRHTLIIDACRVVQRRSLNEMFTKSANVSGPIDDPARSRRIFEQQLRQTYPGLAVMYSCSITESANEEVGLGGVYSSALLTVCREWAKQTPTGMAQVLTVSDAHERAKTTVQRQQANRQNPSAQFPRSLPRFPFAIAV